MSDLLESMKMCLGNDIGLKVWVDELPEVITSLQALQDLETLLKSSGRSAVEIYCSETYGHFWVNINRNMKSMEDTIPAALRAAIEAIKKGETE